VVKNVEPITASFPFSSVIASEATPACRIYPPKEDLSAGGGQAGFVIPIVIRRRVKKTNPAYPT